MNITKQLSKIIAKYNSLLWTTVSGVLNLESVSKVVVVSLVKRLESFESFMAIISASYSALST